MGYKLAGFDVIGNCEIDHKMDGIYKLNLHPKYSYEMDIREFNKIEDLPEVLYDIDILDGSPPCSTFSIAGNREKDWGRERTFAEGQAVQTLDDLFFRFIDTAEKLKPRIIIAENVKGLITGKARGYVNEILKRMHNAGYVPQMFLLNAAAMGVPQKRERIFFIAHRKDMDVGKLVLRFNEPLITFGEVRSAHGKPYGKNTIARQLLEKRRPSDHKVAHIAERELDRNIMFNNVITDDDEVPDTITAGGECTRGYDNMKFSDQDRINAQTFPQDYNFAGRSVAYVCGMSVPPVMMAQISSAVYEQWLS